MIRRSLPRIVRRRLRRAAGGSADPGDRGVTFTVSYVLTIAITTLLIAGVLLASGQIVRDQREMTIRNEATVVGDEVAASVMAADRLVRDGSGANATVGVELPRVLAETPYTVTLSADAIVVETRAPQIRVEIPLRSRTAIASETVAGGDIRVVYVPGSDVLTIERVP